MTTLFDLTLRLARKVTTVRNSTATDGDATSLTDSKMSGLGEWIGGTIWILDGTYSGFARSILENPRDKVEFDTLGGALAGTERYAIADKHAPLDILKGAVTAALDHFRTEQEDATLTQDGDATVYTIPAAVLAANGYDKIVKVEVATETSSPYQWEAPHRHWFEEGSELRFEYDARPAYEGCPLRLTYSCIPELTNDSDIIPVDVNYNALFWRALIELLDMLGDMRPKEKRYDALMNQAQVEWQRAASNVLRPRRADPLALY